MDNNEVIESANNLEVAEQENVVESTTVEDVENVENAEETSENQDENLDNEAEGEILEQNSDKPEAKQSEEDNTAARKARIKAQKDAEKLIEKARKEAYNEAYQKGLKEGKINTYKGKINPYTQTTMEDEIDIQEYLDMYEIDSKGGDPIKDYNKKVKEKAREEAKKQLKIEEEKERENFFNNDVRNFTEKNPNVELEKLFKDEKFNKFSKGKLGTQPLTEIYDDFVELTGAYKKDAIDTAKKVIANNQATPGGVENQQSKEHNWNNMTKEKFQEYVEKAKNGELI